MISTSSYLESGVNDDDDDKNNVGGHWYGILRWVANGHFFLILTSN